MKIACLWNPAASWGRKIPDLHIPSILAAYFVQRMRHAAKATNLPSLHQRLKRILPPPSRLLQLAQQRRRLPARGRYGKRSDGRLDSLNNWTSQCGQVIFKRSAMGLPQSGFSGGGALAMANFANQ
jgi:hypothetical protein